MQLSTAFRVLIIFALSAEHSKISTS
ncbi:hypothetical protein OOU_Y34scaffold00216g8 [Pyricularia oryzae Y34]|uniref:Uncharacterized protein n=2 Tax=Pyricularia oryzae TaxID=318829 RepID=A0AA97P5E3_PYRO3|nr:hypothetical protein OOU_Y34scaffold00216g8 [Pyricularia oryzae Y34]